MRAPANDAIGGEIDRLFRLEGRRVFATLVRVLGDFDLAEDALHDAFASALGQWPLSGIPANPRAWLISAGRFRAIDAMRRRSRWESSLDKVADQLESGSRDDEVEAVEDDQLRLIFTCCHPALAPEARTALTLREVCGLTTEEIARAFLTAPPTIAQRIVRAKAKIRETKIPYEVPSAEELPDRLETVLQVVYLVFNEGYSASSGASVTRSDLSGEAIRLGRRLLDLLPDPEVRGLLALMLLQESRRIARTSADGDLVLLEDQDRSLWNRDFITEGVGMVEQSLASRHFGPYTLQAAIAAVHSEAAAPAETDWAQIAELYRLLLEIEHSPVIELNQAVAIAMRDGPEAGLKIIDRILDAGELSDYAPVFSARAELCRRAGRVNDARQSYNRALALTSQEPERRFLTRRLQEIA